MDKSLIITIGLAFCSGAAGLAYGKPRVYLDVGEAFGQLLMRLTLIIALVYLGILVAQFLIYDAIDKSFAGTITGTSAIEVMRRAVSSSMSTINTAYAVGIGVGAFLTAANESLLYLAKRVLHHERLSNPSELQHDQHSEMNCLDGSPANEEGRHGASPDRQRPEP